MATKYILDPSGNIIKAGIDQKIDPVTDKTYINETLKNISAKENENDNNLDAFLSNVRLGLLEGDADQDRLTEYITSKVDQDPSFGFIDEDGNTKFGGPEQVDSFKPFNSFNNTSKVFADEFEILTGFRLRSDEFDDSLQTTLLMFTYFAELVAKFATVEAIIFINKSIEGEKNVNNFIKGNIEKKTLKLGKYDFTEYDILTKYVYNVLNYPHESSNIHERIMAYFIGFTEWLSPDIIFDYHLLFSEENALENASQEDIKRKGLFSDFSGVFKDTTLVAITSLLEIFVSTLTNHTSINRV